jgi:hypothetical protein
MISRRTARKISEIYVKKFKQAHTQLYSSSSYYYTINKDDLYDFLFDNDYPAWFCNAGRATYEHAGTRKFKDFIMKIHTGESLAAVTPNWSWEQREELGQKYLRDLAKDILNHFEKITDIRSKEYMSYDLEELKRNLELDGYKYDNLVLLPSESDVLDVEEETGVLDSLFTSLELDNNETAIHHLKLSEEHYISERWDDSVSNSRKYLECVLQEVAAKHYHLVHGKTLNKRTYERPSAVREYLEKEGLIESKEKEAISSTYSLLSHTGGHPYMAKNDQARLLRHLSLTFSQFVMLRLKGKISSK